MIQFIGGERMRQPVQDRMNQLARSCYNMDTRL
jgi:hypothetical protein